MKRWLQREWTRLKIQDQLWRPKKEASEYAWKTTETSDVSDHIVEHYFTTRDQARAHKRATESAMTNPKVTYEQVRMPDEGGWM